MLNITMGVELINIIVLFPVLAYIVYYDIKYKLIRDQSLLVIIVLQFVMWLLGVVSIYILSGVVIFFLLSLMYIALYFRRKIEYIGIGDIKLLFVLGLYIPLDYIPLLLFLSGLFGVCSGLFVFPSQREFPFAPAIVMAFIVINALMSYC